MGGGNAMPVNSFENYPMSWKPDLSNTKPPLYLALARQLEDDIKAGALKPGTKLPPQRELADYLDINLSTVSRAFKICEQKGLLSASVGNGTYIATVYKGNIIKNLIMDCQSYTKYRPNETTGGIFVSWRRKEELPTGA